MSTLSAYELDVLWPTVKSLLPHAARTDLHNLLDSLPPESPIELTATPTRIELKTPHTLVSVERSQQGRMRDHERVDALAQDCPEMVRTALNEKAAGL